MALPQEQRPLAKFRSRFVHATLEKLIVSDNRRSGRSIESELHFNKPCIDSKRHKYEALYTPSILDIGLGGCDSTR